jgi:hypothetical protein
MNKRVMRFGLVLLALATLSLAGGVGGKARPFKAESRGYITADYWFTYDFFMSGHATHLGRFECQFLGIQWLFPEEPGDPCNIADGTLIAANGDSVNVHMEDYYDHFDDSLGAVANGTYVITGGTGRFLNASGTGSFIAIIDVFSSDPPETSFTFDGTIVY